MMIICHCKDVINKMNSYLDKREMDYHWYSTAENSVRPKLCAMTHAVVPTISCNSNTSSKGLQPPKHLTLVFLPIKINQWEKLGLKKTNKTA